VTVANPRQHRAAVSLSAILERTRTEDLHALLAEEYAEPPTYASAEHRRFFESKAPEIVASGWMGAGKSRVLCQKAWWVARTYPGVTVALFRKTAASLPATTARTFERDVVDMRYVSKRNKSENWWELTNGSRIYFLGLDPDPITGVPSKVGSLDLGWAGVDEAVELSESDWIMLLGRLRDPRMDWHQLAAATNPAHPKHWLRARMLADVRRELIAIKANKFLSPEYVAMLADLPDTAAGRRLGRGEWAAAEGVIWTLPDAQVRGPGEVLFKTVIAGLDWGFVHAFACEVLGVSGAGRIMVIDELYVRGRTLPEVIPGLLALREKWGIQQFYADPSEPAYIAECQAAGLPVTAATNDVLPGIDSVAAAIKDGMTVDPTCDGLLGELPGYTWAPDRQGGLKEKPVEINDDACDALRYGVMAVRRPTWVGAADVAVA
jgi:PBSX family phage terminase large subunit